MVAFRSRESALWDAAFAGAKGDHDQSTLESRSPPRYPANRLRLLKARHTASPSKSIPIDLKFPHLGSQCVRVDAEQVGCTAVAFDLTICRGQRAFDVANDGGVQRIDRPVVSICHNCTGGRRAYN